MTGKRQRTLWTTTNQDLDVLRLLLYKSLALCFLGQTLLSLQTLQRYYLRGPLSEKFLVLPAFSKIRVHHRQNSLPSVKQTFFLDTFNLNQIASKTLYCNNWLIYIDMKDSFSE